MSGAFRADVVCAGGAAVDTTFAAAEAPVLGREVRAAARTSFGGVARNVAANLAALGRRTALCSIVGDDAPGRALIADLRARGIQTRAVRAVAGAPTAAYTAILHPDGEVALAAADMSLFARFGGIDVDAAHAAAAHARWLFADGNLPQRALRALLQPGTPRACRVALDAASVAAAAQLPRALAGVEVIFANAAEAAAYLEVGGIAPSDAARALVERGAAAAVVTCGPHGCAVAHADGDVVLAATAAHALDVTGAGDALAAATLHALLEGAPLDAAVQRGIHAAARTVQVRGTVA